MVHSVELTDIASTLSLRKVLHRENQFFSSALKLIVVGGIVSRLLVVMCALSHASQCDMTTLLVTMTAVFCCTMLDDDSSPLSWQEERLLTRPRTTAGKSVTGNLVLMSISVGWVISTLVIDALVSITFYWSDFFL